MSNSETISVCDLVERPIDVTALLDAVRTPEAGAVVVFLGTVRRTTHGRSTDSLTYEAYRSMAVKEMQRVLTGIAGEWPICHLAAEHRVGALELGEIAVAITVSGPHRDETFAAGRAAIDRIKDSVPIWKQEHWADGEIEWVDPTGSQMDIDPTGAQTNIASTGAHTKTDFANHTANGGAAS